MGMSRRDFWESTAREVFNAISGFYDHQMYLQRQEWIRERWSTCILLNTQTTKSIRETELLEFEWEKEEKRNAPVKVITQEELKKLAEFYDKPGR